MKDEFLTIQEAASFFRVTTRTLRRWEDKGFLTAQRTLGNQRRYSKVQLAQLLGPASVPTIREIPEHKQEALLSQPEQVPPSMPVIEPSTLAHGFKMPEQVSQKRLLRQPHGAMALGGMLAVILFSSLTVMGLSNGQGIDEKRIAFINLLRPNGQGTQSSGGSVLASTDRVSAFVLKVNVPAMFSERATFLDAVAIKGRLKVERQSDLFGGINTNNSDIDAGTGSLTASNVIYSLLAGTNITIAGDPQNPTISASGGVNSIQGQTGSVAFSEGTGIGLDGLQITNTGVLSLQGQSGAVNFSEGTGIGLDGLTITNSDPGSAQKIFGTVRVGSTDIIAGNNVDILTFTAGSGITLTPNAGTKTLTITSDAAGVLTGMTTNGVLYATSATTATSTNAGSNGFILKSNGPGAAPEWIAPGTALGFVPFDFITSGTNTGAAMVIGSGASLGYTGTGTINASSLLGNTWVAPGAIGSTTPNTGAFTTLTATTINGLTVTANGSNTLTIATGKTIALNNSLALSGIDGTAFTFPTASGTLVSRDSTDTLTNKTIAAGSNTITGLTNANLSGTAGITNANLANSSITVTAGTGLSGGGTVALGGSVALTNAGVTSLTGTANQVNVSGATGAVTLSLPQNINTAASPTFAGLTLSGLTTNGGVAYTNGSGTFAQTTAGSLGQCLTSNGGGSPIWSTCAAGQNLWQSNNGTVSPFSNTLDLLVGGTSTASAKFAFLNNNTGTPIASISANTANNATYLTGAGNLGTTNAQTLTLGGGSTGNVVIDAGSGAIVLSDSTSVAGNLNLLTGNAFQINGTSVLNGTTLGGGVLSSSLTTVGELVGGSIASGFGVISTGNNITTTATLTGGTVNSTGALQTAGTNRVDASGNLVNIAALTASGTITLSGLSTGVVKSNASGVLSSSAVGLNTSDVTGTLAIGNGGTGLASTPTNGQLLIGNGTGYTLAGLTGGTAISIGNAAGAITINNTGVTSAVAGTGIGVSGATGAVTFTNTGVTSLAGTANQVNVSGGTGAVTLSLPQDINIAASPTFAGLTLSALNANGGVLYTNGSGTVAQTIVGSLGQCLTSNGGGTPTWSTCAAGQNLWQSNNGTVSPFSNTLDLLVGGTSTASAKFAFINNLTGTPTASVSAGATGATYLTADGTVQTTANQSLSLGGSTTGNILLNSDGNSRVGIGTAAPTATLDVNGNLALTGTGRRILADFTDGTFSNRTLFQSSVTDGITSVGVIPNGTATESRWTIFNNSNPDAGAASYFASRITGTRSVLTSGSNAGGGLPLAFEIGFDSEVGRFDTSGRFGIGALSSTAFDNRLYVQSADQDAAKLYRNSTTSGDEVRLNFAVSSDATFEAGYISGIRRVADAAGMDLAFGTNTGGTTPTERLRITGTGTVGIGTIAPLATLDVRGQSGTLPIASFSGQTSNASLIVDNNGVGDLFTASKSGATKFVINNAGNVGIGTATPRSDLDLGRDGAIFTLGGAGNGATIRFGAAVDTNSIGYNNNGFNFLTNQTNGFEFFTNTDTDLVTAEFRIADNGNITLGASGYANCGSLTTVSNVVTCGSIGATQNYWQLNAGAVSPFSNTADLLVGGTSTASAKFAFINSIGAGVPTASIAGSLTNVATSLTGNGVLGTTNAQTLQLGSVSTGNVSLAPGGVTALTALANGNVGIGTTNPAYPLEIAKNQAGFAVAFISNSSTTTNAGAALTAGENGTNFAQLAYLNNSYTGVGLFQPNRAVLRAFSASGSNGLLLVTQQAAPIIFATGGTADNNERMRIDGSGNVGIGTSTPLATLDIRGISGTTPIASISGQTSNAGLIVDNNGVGDLFTASKSGASKFTILNNGNIRINNLNTASCDVKADTTGLLSCGTDAGAAATTLQTAYDSDVDGSDAIISLLAADDSLIFRNPASGGTDSTFLLNLDQLATGASDALVINSAGANANFGLRVNDDGTSSDSTPFVVDNTGSVGIGTTAPLATLDIRGQSGTTPIASFSGQTSNAGLIVDNRGSGDIFAASQSGATKFAIQNNGNLFFQGATNNAFGTTLQIADPTANRTVTLPNASGTVTLLTSGSSQNGVSAFTQGGQTWATTAVLGTQDANALNLITNNNTRFSIDANGNIGAGTTTALASFDIRANSGTTAIASVSGQTSNAGFIVDNNGVGDLFTASKSGATHFVIKNNGNVGIGTANPVDKLEVNGAIRATNQLNFSDATFGQVQTLTANAYLDFKTAAGTGAITFTPNAIETLRLTSSGLASLGTTTSTPLGTLDVRARSGTLSIASVSGQTSNAGFIVDNNGLGDLFTASKSGATKFTVLNNGNVRVNNLNAASCDVKADTTGLLSCGTDAGAAATTLQTAYDSDVDGSDAIISLLAADDSLIFRNPAAGGTDSTFLLNLDQLSTGARDALVINSAGSNANFGFRVNDDGTATDSTPFAIDNTGNVGIGTTTPGAKLHIAADSAADFATEIYNNNATGLGAYIYVNNSAASDALRIESTIGQIFNVKNNGSIGVNASSPLATFDVRGNIGTTPVASFSGTTAIAGLIVDNNGVGDLFTASKSGKTHFVINNTGNVGIGTTTASQLLHLRNIGDAQLLIDGDTDNSGENDNPSIRLTQDGGASALQLGMVGDAGQIFTNSLLNAGYFGTTSNDDLQIITNNTLRMTFEENGETGIGTSDPNSNFDVVTTAEIAARFFSGSFNDTTITIGDNNAAITGEQYVTYRNGNTGTNAWMVGMDDDELFSWDYDTAGEIVSRLMTLDQSGKLGLGTSTMLGTLDVRAQSGTLAIASVSGLTSRSALIVDNNGVGDLFTASKSGATKFVVKNNGRVGIGTANPTNTLDVNGGVSILEQLDILGTYALIQAAGSNDLQLRTAGTGDILFQTNSSTEVARLTDTGQFGLGTASPLATLDVRAQSGTLAIASVSGLTSRSALIVDNNGVGDLFTASKSGATKFVVKNNGFVGIGGASGANALEVAGTTADDSVVFRDAVGSNNYLAFGTNRAGAGYNDIASVIGGAFGDLLLNRGGGNVGIGLVDPISPLEVRGATRLNYITNPAGYGLNVGGGVRFSQWNTTDTYANFNIFQANTGYKFLNNDGATELLRITGTGSVGIGTANPLAGLDVRGNSGTTPVASFSGTSSFAGLVVDNNGVGDIFTASKSGKPMFTVTNAGGLVLGGAPTTAIDINNTGVTNDIELQNDEVIRNNTNGKVEILSNGTTVLLDVDTVDFDINLSNTTTFTERLCHNGGNGGTGVASIADCSGTPGDYAEEYGTSDASITAGDVVAIDPTREAEAVEDNGLQGSKSWIVKATQPSEKGLIGIISTQPNDVIGRNFTDAENPRPVALNGRVPVKISSASAAIQPGDMITSSSDAGKAMKATQSGMTIGRALESWSPESGKSTIHVFVNLTWYEPGVSFNDAGNLSVDGQAMSNEALPPMQSASNAAPSAFNDNSSFNPETFNDRVATSGALLNLTDRVSSLNTMINGLTDRITSLENLASGSALVTTAPENFTASSAAELSLDTLDVTDATVSNTLAVLGRTTLSDVGITGRVNIGLLSIDGLNEDGLAAINTSAGALQLQSNGLNGIAILGGKMTIDTKGNLQTEGEITAKKINIDTAEVASASIGEVVLESGSTKVIVKTKALTTKSKIFVQAQEIPLSTGVKKIGVDTFEIRIRNAETSDVKLNWWIVN